MIGGVKKFQMVVSVPGRVMYILQKETMECVLAALKALECIEHKTGIFMRPPADMLFCRRDFEVVNFVFVFSASSPGMETHDPDGVNFALKAAGAEPHQKDWLDHLMEEWDK